MLLTSTTKAVPLPTFDFTNNLLPIKRARLYPDEAQFAFRVPSSYEYLYYDVGYPVEDPDVSGDVSIA
jgi:hypothetical protein